MKRIVTLFGTIILLAACSSAGQPTGTPTVVDPTSNNKATSSPSSPTDDVGTTSDATPATATGTGKAQVDIVRTFFRNWDYEDDYVHYEIVLEVRNSGTAAADTHAGDQSYTIYNAKDGTVLVAGKFYYSFPQVLEPGALGYYVDGGRLERGTSASNIGELKPSLSSITTDKTPVAWEISDLVVTKESFYGNAQVNGMAKNTSDKNADLGVVGVILFDANDEIAGAVIDHRSVRGLGAGQSKAFESSNPGIPLADPASITSTKAFGLEYYQ